MISKFLAGAACFAALVSCATANRMSGENAPMTDEVKAKLATFDRTGETLSCLGLRQISEIKPLDDYRFLVRVGNDYYLNTVSGRCSRAADGFTHLEYSTSLSHLCRNEIINVVDNSQGFQVGACGLGGFERLKSKEEKK